jgi:hypothetical protein
LIEVAQDSSRMGGEIDLLGGVAKILGDHGAVIHLIKWLAEPERRV